MKKCNKCNIVISTEYDYCPLCHQILSGSTEDSHVELYPHTYVKRKSLSPKAQNIIFFFTILSIIVLAIINVNHPGPGFWSLIPIGAIIYLWFLIKFVVFTKSSSIVRITIITLFISILLFLINLQTDIALLWSLDYVLPSLIIINNTTIFMILMIKKEGFKYNSSSLLLLITVSFLPLLLFYLNVITVLTMPLMCYAHGMLIILFMLVFYPNVLKELLKRIFHI